MTQQGGNFGFTDAGATADRDDYPAIVGVFCRQGYQQGENRVGLGNMFRPDLDLVSGHIPLGNGPVRPGRGPAAQTGRQFLNRVNVHILFLVS